MAGNGVSHACSPTSPDDMDNLAGLEKELESSQTTCDMPAEVVQVAWRKLDKWILPLLAGFFLFAVLDKTNIANANVAGFQNSLAISNYQYTMALTVTYIPYIAAESPFVLLLKYLGPNRMIPAAITLWGVASAAQGFVSKYSELLVCRCFLGLFEGGISPAIIFYLSLFYPRKRLQTRIAALYALSSLPGAFSGLLAAAIDQINVKGGRPGWAWIFILEGIFTIVFGLLSMFLLPRSPATAFFLTEKEKLYVVSTLKDAGSMSEDEHKDSFSWVEVIKAVKSPHVWLLAAGAFFNGAINNGITYFEPTIVAGLGYAGNQAQLMSVPPYAVTFVLCILSAIVSDHYHCRGYTMVFLSLFDVIGFTMFYASSSSHVRYASLFFSVAGAVGVMSTTYTWVANNSTPHARRATALALTSVLGNLGGILATWMLGFISPAPEYTTATITFIAMSAAVIVLSTINMVYLWRENRLKARSRQRVTKEDEPEGLGDRSAWFVYSL